MVVTLALILTFSPGEKERPLCVAGFANACPAIQLHELQRDGERFSLSSEERAGVRSSVQSNFSSSVVCNPAKDAAHVPVRRAPGNEV